MANLLDSYALSMINLAVPVGFLFNTVSVLCGRGGSTLYSICRGNHDREGADVLFSLSMIFTMLLSLVIMVFGLLFTPQIVALLGIGQRFFVIVTLQSAR